MLWDPSIRLAPEGTEGLGAKMTVWQPLYCKLQAARVLFITI